MKLSVTLIVRDEEINLKRLLPQLGFADEIVVVDTGSVDGTCRVAEAYAKVFHFAWEEDFSKARNYAISKATGDFVMWLDADDVLPPNTQKQLMGWKNSHAEADFYYMRYRMDGDFPFWFWRERLIRRCPKCVFKGFIHEAIRPFGKTDYLDCEVIHRPAASHERRNLLIYRHAVAAGKRLSLRDKYYFARTLAENGCVDEAVPLLSKFVANPRAALADRVEGYKILARIFMAHDPRAALTYLSKSVKLLPPNGETCCLFGQIYFDAQNWQTAAEWYSLALSSRSENGFVNEFYNGFFPNVQLCVCLWNLGRFAEAKERHLAAKAVAPTHPTVVDNDVFFNRINL